ncbi:hypothetical protein GCK72_016012 [Caenorhabditis remanei]|uniref:Uncharacterized protein n=1 Tax=Caenorhabditis remanei TaxID=31234 RepID=A0A6A5GYB6_CAERE|nr:hypothetical protein GCK72_016012 [Caenorhabditis remanei]KAF1759545.1 hypothetical protein GCK72_016012 [Caenorhabditis remanei]
MENLKSENQKLQESLKKANASRIQKVEAPVREILGFKTILENFLAAQTPEQLDNSETQKNQEILDQQEELKKKIENLEAELKKKKADGLIRQFDLECVKKKHLEVVEQLATKVVQLELALEKSPVVNANQTRKELSREEKRALKIHLEVLERKHQEFLDSVGEELDKEAADTNKNLLEIIKKAKQQIYELKENSDIARMESTKSLQKKDVEIQKLKKEINKLEAENSSEIFRHENLIDELHKSHNKELGACQERRLEEFTELTNQLKALYEENTQLKTEVHDQKITLRTLERENVEIEELFCKMQDERWRKENDYEAQLIEKNEEIAELEMLAETGECSWSTLGLFDEGVQQVD